MVILYSTQLWWSELCLVLYASMLQCATYTRGHPMKTYTPEHIAEMLHVDTETVRRWARAGSLSGVRLGRAGWRFTEDDLQSFLEAYRTRQPEKMMRNAETTT